MSTQRDAITGGEPEEFLARRSITKTRLDYFGIGYEEYDWLLESDAGTVISAAFDPDDVATSLTSSGYDPSGSFRGYQLFARSDTPRRAAVGEEQIIWASDGVHDRPDVEQLIRTNAGEFPRYHEVSDGFERISRDIGANRMLIIGPEIGDPTNFAELGADGFRFADSVGFQVIKLLFPSGHPPTRADLEEAFRDQYWTTEEADVFDVHVDGRLATIETQVPRQADRTLTPITDPPQIT